MSRTKTFDVEGIKTTRFGMGRQMFVVRYTSDKLGKSLSIADETSGTMFHIPFDQLYKVITEGDKS